MYSIAPAAPMFPLNTLGKKISLPLRMPNRAGDAMQPKNIMFIIFFAITYALSFFLLEILSNHANNLPRAVNTAIPVPAVNPFTPTDFKSTLNTTSSIAGTAIRVSITKTERIK